MKLKQGNAIPQHNQTAEIKYCEPECIKVRHKHTSWCDLIIRHGFYLYINHYIENCLEIVLGVFQIKKLQSFIIQRYVQVSEDL